MPPRQEFRAGELVQAGHALAHRRLAARERHAAAATGADHQLALVVEVDLPAVEQQIAEARIVEIPVAQRAGIDVDEARIRIPADAAAPHRARRLHSLRQLGVEMYVERAAVKVLAVLGDPEIGAREHLVRLARAVGREDLRLALPDRIHDRAEKVEDADIHADNLAAVSY